MKILNLVFASLAHPHGITSWFRNYCMGVIEYNSEHDIYFASIAKPGDPDDFRIESNKENFTHYCFKYEWKQLSRVLNSHEYDIIHYHTALFPPDNDYMDYYIFDFFKHKFKGRLISTIHSLQKMDMSFELYNPMERPKEFWADVDMFLQSIYKTDKMINFSSDVVYISNQDLEWSKEVGSYNEDTNNLVIYNGLPTMDKKIKSTYKSGNIGYAHRFVQRKNWHTLDEAAKLNPNQTFYLAGDSIGTTPLVHSLYKNRENVVFLGKLNRQGIIDLNKEIDIMLCPAQYEPFGLTAMESLFDGVIPIVCEETGTHEVLGDAAFTFNGTPIDLSRAIKEFYDVPDDEIIDRLKQQQESVSLKSDTKVMLDNYFTLYEEK
jgi:glycosyltransferase involved in cell wall biosynthesis